MRSKTKVSENPLSRAHSNFLDLLLMLIVRDVKIRYKQSVLGIAWAIFQPLSLMLIFTFVFSQVAQVNTRGIPYPVFAYVGLMSWQFFRAAILAATGCLVAQPALITKIYCPREVFPMAAILSKLIDFGVSFLILFLLMLYYRLPVSITVLWFPLLFGVQLLFMLGIGFMVSMGNLFYRDVGYIMDVLLVIWMFATAVVYPMEGDSGWSAKLFALNPLTPLFNSYRDVLIHGFMPSWKQLLYPFVWAVAMGIGGYWWYLREEPLFAERI